ncbi:RNA polymerase sigma factor [Psychroflexus salis]|uniref:DNA-directed RNA polymerase sigma-70 factor n=1 Tax=Psychroflexus salis TaxID=1526574 RepID=A0A916ZSA8_9FLAO|nr:sigma-70 family RNA polymerase sigma factor [Psychroflexus salis]GGE11865.1 DNA-directed RNA polymerase sigma-70 factor [Psychroflexus salis]
MTENEMKHIQLAQERNQIGFNFLVKYHWNYVYHFIFKRTKNAYLTEEVCIQSFAKAFDKIDLFNPEFEFKTWLVQIAKNLLIDEYRKKSIETQELNKNSLQIIEESSIEDAQIMETNKENIARELRKLQGDYQLVLQKYYFESMSFKEISEELNIPINNLKVKAYRAKQKLQKLLKEK